MKELIRQFYTEGFATTFIDKPIDYIKKRTNSKNKIKVYTFIIKLLYTLIFIGLAIYVLYKKLHI